jgi:hypothetical protein
VSDPEPVGSDAGSDVSVCADTFGQIGLFAWQSGGANIKGVDAAALYRMAATGSMAARPRLEAARAWLGTFAGLAFGLSCPSR